MLIQRNGVPASSHRTSNFSLAWNSNFLKRQAVGGPAPRVRHHDLGRLDAVPRQRDVVHQHRRLQCLADRLQDRGGGDVLHVDVAELIQRGQRLGQRPLRLPADRPDFQAGLGLDRGVAQLAVFRAGHEAIARRPQHAGQGRAATQSAELLLDLVVAECRRGAGLQLQGQLQLLGDLPHHLLPGDPLGAETDRRGEVLADAVQLGRREAQRPFLFPLLGRAVRGQVVEPLGQPAGLAAAEASAGQLNLVAREHDAGDDVERAVGGALDVDLRLARLFGGAEADVADAGLAQRPCPLLEDHCRAAGVADQFQLDRSRRPRRQGGNGQTNRNNGSKRSCRNRMVGWKR